MPVPLLYLIMFVSASMNLYRPDNNLSCGWSPSCLMMVLTGTDRDYSIVSYLQQMPIYQGRNHDDGPAFGFKWLFLVPAPDSRVEYDIWLSPGDTVSRLF
jgi:hypothetical protein